MTIDQVKSLKVGERVLAKNGLLWQVVHMERRCCHFTQLEFPFDEVHVDFFYLTDEEAGNMSRMN